MFRTLLRTSPLVARPSARLFSTSRAVFNSTSHKLNKDSHVYKYLQEGPSTIKYTAEHEWLAIFKDDSAFVGITTYASEALGDVTFVELPEVGDKVEVGDTIGSVESVKSASEIYSPVAGEVVAINDVLESEPQLINTDPIGNGWIAQIKLSDPAAIESSEELLSAEEYENSLSEN
ncbi:H-protein subunit of glycine cleavage system [Suhomyces tanzawaensis NRRL Y-17324]|uniref:Glycine cleavage system H protein n=1 Tax=Suhomyces tanzawaensis NRRL Y-17324 TaxID=984487 RepID=A0A1E4SE81_9ASCO|nr:H-protein subunit of glycine cleavage system [Suhomyces tanzawaensis NRRL Y-17324]ODV77829.1 H-protein subunit of glycine cleavage system [Suhomyces tanzawaensis NRRL Y-17324]